MYAIVNDSGRQYKVSEGEKILVDVRDAKKGDAISFDEVLLYAAGDDVRIGTPTVKGVSVSGEVLGFVKGEKIIVFKKKKRKKIRNTKGHRQGYIEVLIKEIKTK